MCISMIKKQKYCKNTLKIFKILLKIIFTWLQEIELPMEKDTIIYLYVT